jgi:hypothetical protein
MHVFLYRFDLTAAIAGCGIIEGSFSPSVLIIAGLSFR